MGATGRAAAEALAGRTTRPARDLEDEDVRIAPIGQLSVIFFANRALRHLSVLGVVWLG
ncbi:hypothetical protein [Streptomyces sp. NPDC005476]|uniref:hypothetical protein n=1 Tax=Streptomyces sp. NPDC005476 TaxID=3156882 RepID=UPI003456650E